MAQQSVALVAGGPLVQATQTARHLPAQGVTPSFFCAWDGFDRASVDLVHVFGANLMTYDVAARLTAYEIPYVVSSIFFTSHSSARVRLARRAETLLRRVAGGVWTDYGFAHEVCVNAQMVLPNSQAEADLVAKGLEIDGSRIRTVPNGVDERFAHADPELFIRTYGVKDFILNVGHIGAPRKNLLRLIRALERIDHPAVIIGRVHAGEYADMCLGESRRNRNLTIIEGLPNDSDMLASAYAAARVFVLPSTFETPGIAALEAALAGAAIVITPAGGTRDYFGSMAVYVEPQSVDSIAGGIERALREGADPGLQDHIRREFLWERVAARTAAVYREVVER
jgi:glycosyltransferase involved in cell wall biosynthesis